MINKLIQNGNYYNSTKSSNNTTNSSKTVATSFRDIMATSNVTKSGNDVANSFSNGSSDSATENVDPDEYNIPEPTRYFSPNGDFHMTLIPSREHIVYSGGSDGKMVFDLIYAEHSTDENPIMSARGQDENGDEFTQLITINKIDPSNATPVEMIALQAHLSGGKLYESSELTWLKVGVHGDNELGQNLADRNNYITPLKDNINIYSNSIDPDSQVFAKKLSKVLDGLLAFMNKTNTNNNNYK